MSVHPKGNRWTVRWRQDGRQRARSFQHKQDADTFDKQRRQAAKDGTEIIVLRVPNGPEPRGVRIITAAAAIAAQTTTKETTT